MDPKMTQEFAPEQNAEKSRASSTMPCLVEVSGDLPGRTFTLESPVYLVGRDEACAIQAEVEGVSRRHCELIRKGDGYEIEDLASTNGIHINGQKVQKHQLLDGDRISLGPKATYTYRVYHLDEGRVLSQISEAVTKDPVTGAPNREHLVEWLQSQIAVAREQNFEIAVFAVALECPEDAPEDLATQLFQVLRSSQRPGLQIARMGGLLFGLALSYSKDVELNAFWQPLSQGLARLGQFGAGLATTHNMVGATPERVLREAQQKLRLAQFDIPNSLVR